MIQYTSSMIVEALRQTSHLQNLRIRHSGKVDNKNHLMYGSLCMCVDCLSMHIKCVYDYVVFCM